MSYLIIVATTDIAVTTLGQNPLEPIDSPDEYASWQVTGRSAPSLSLKKGTICRIKRPACVQVTGGEAIIIVDPQDPPVPPFAMSGGGINAMLQGDASY
jgi:hypothetical protein